MENWFEEQLNARRRNDRDAMNDAYAEAVNAVIGESFSFDEIEDELTIILHYYHLPSVKVSDKITDDAERLSAACRMSGLMQRPVRLEPGWYRNAFGAFLCRYADTGETVAVLPGKLGGYEFYDRAGHTHVRLNRRTAKRLSDEAICFYKPLPNEKLSIFDLVRFGLSTWSVADYILTVGMLAIATLVGLLTPKLSYFLYNTVVTSGSVSLLLSTMTFILSLSLSMLFLNAMQSMFSARSGIKMSAALQSAAMMRTLSMPVSFFRQFSSGEIMSRMGYIDSLGRQIVDMLFSTTLSGLFSLAYVTQIFRYAPSLVVPSLLVILANVLFSVYTTLRQTKISQRQMELAARNSGTGIEIISGIQKIKMSGSERRMFARYTKAFAEQSRIVFNPPVFNKYNGVISQAITLTGTLVLYYCAIRSQVSVAEYYSFQSAYGMISAAITSLAGIALQIATLRPSLEMVRPMLETVPETHENAQDVTFLNGAIDLSNVSFRYDEKGPDIIHNLSLSIKPGEYVAIVGKTGCGKSTLIRLLLGFEKPQQGTVSYDGRDLNTLEKRSLRRKIGTVMQDDRLFTGDIYSNIVICAPTLTMDEAWAAAETAGIADDIRDMPMGMNTLIAEGSGGISGGQRQRLVIARAIAPKPKILIFDEATSALDNITQKKVAEALDGLNCTRIVIAHRLSTIRHCDRILVLDKGQITEQGTYEELVEKNGYFAELVERQRLDK